MHWKDLRVAQRTDLKEESPVATPGLGRNQRRLGVPAQELRVLPSGVAIHQVVAQNQTLLVSEPLVPVCRFWAGESGPASVRGSVPWGQQWQSPAPGMGCPRRGGSL